MTDPGKDIFQGKNLDSLVIEVQKGDWSRILISWKWPTDDQMEEEWN